MKQLGSKSLSNSSDPPQLNSVQPLAAVQPLGRPVGPLFDLLSQPFHLLAVEPGATNERIEEAFRSLQIRSGRDASLSARDVVLAPGGRLYSELSYPIDSSPSQVETLYALISSETPVDEILLFATELRPLSRANLFAHLAAHRPPNSTVLCVLIEAHASIEIPTVYADLKRLRASAGWPAPSLVSVHEGLQQLRAGHMQAAIPGVANALDALSSCTTKILAGGEQYQIEALAGLIDAYRQISIPQQEHSTSQVETACHVLGGRPDDGLARDALAQLLRSWSTLCHPFMLFDNHRGTIDPIVTTCANYLRDLLAELLDQHHYNTALSVAYLARDTFEAIPDIVEQLDGEIPLIEQSLMDAAVHSLRHCIDQIEHNLSSLVSVSQTGFGSASTGEAKQLWEVFVQATRLADTDEPWMMVRDLATQLKEQSEKAATALLAGLIVYGNQVSASSAVLRALSAKLPRVEAAFSTVVETSFPSRFAREVKSDGRRRLRITVAFFAMLLLGGLVTSAALYYKGDRLRSLMTSYSQAVPIQSQAELESMPTVGTGQHLELGGVRYCHYQEQRLQMIKPEVKSAEDARAFNLLVVDYNSRCSDFFFKDADLATVKAEIANNQQRLMAAAKAILSTWPGHNAPEVGK